jgi:hypothetical protein
MEGTSPSFPPHHVSRCPDHQSRGSGSYRSPSAPYTKRVYDPKQKEFSVGGPPSFPIAEADSVYRLGLVPDT